MKPLSEFVKEWRARGWNPYADELEAWLREADEWAEEKSWDAGVGWLRKSEVRCELLGTTRTEGKK